MRARSRDTQRSKVYAAERAAFGWDDHESCSAIQKMTLAEVEEFVGKVWAQVWDSKLGTKARTSNPPIVKDGRGRRSCYSAGGEVGFTRLGRERWVVLHELAHELTADRYAWHGPEWCQCYLSLVERFLGFEARERLGAEMRKRRVRTRP